MSSKDSYGHEVLYTAHPTMFRNRPFSFIGAVILIPAFGLGLIILLAWFINTRAKKITITRRHVTYRTGILSKRVNELRIADVRDINIYQDFLERITKVGSLEIAAAGATSNSNFFIKGIPNPEKVKYIIHHAEETSVD